MQVDTMYHCILSHYKADVFDTTMSFIIIKQDKYLLVNDISIKHNR